MKSAITNAIRRLLCRAKTHLHRPQRNTKSREIEQRGSRERLPQEEQTANACIHRRSWHYAWEEVTEFDLPEEGEGILRVFVGGDKPYEYYAIHRVED